MVAFFVLVITIILTFLFGQPHNVNALSEVSEATNISEHLVVGGADVFCADLASGTKNVLIVDVANLYGDSASTAKESAYIGDQDQLFKKYLSVMSKLYDSMWPDAKHQADAKHLKNEHFSNGHTQIHFVMKNHKVGGKDGAPHISEKTWKALRRFVKDHPRSLISVIEDYKTYDMAKWKEPKNHYLRGADDYVCFLLSQEYKKGYKLACIMSNDKYKDFPKLYMIPPFTVRRISADDDGNVRDSGGIADDAGVAIIAKIDPSKHKLGQFVDYLRVPISYDFSFVDYKKRNRIA